MCGSHVEYVIVVMVADTDGMVKVLSDKTSDRLLGVHIMGAVSIKHYVKYYMLCNIDCWGVDQ